MTLPGLSYSITILPPAGHSGCTFACGGTVTGALAAICYALLCLPVLSEEYALLFGALAILFLLAVTMTATRKLDWYRVAESHKHRP